MKVMTIVTIEEWNDLIPLLIDGDYHIFQSQYQIDAPEGAISRFTSGHQMIEIVTRSQVVQDAIARFCQEHR